MAKAFNPSTPKSCILAQASYPINLIFSTNSIKSSQKCILVISDALTFVNKL